jgi:hypothetical protein
MVAIRKLANPLCYDSERLNAIDSLYVEAYPPGHRARSSAVEHSLHTRRVTGSIPVAPTKFQQHYYVVSRTEMPAFAGMTV